MGVMFLPEIEEIDFSDWCELEDWINYVIKKEGFTCGDLSFKFMSDEDLLTYNVDFLNHNFLTDIITFDAVDFDVIHGDILISIDRVKDNSLMLGVPYRNEFCRVVVHGVLHLCGYKDKEPQEISVMRSKENYYLKQRSFT